jgi:hypothetical protein
MSVFDPHDERFNALPRYIESDRACVGCGYNLVGLKTTDVCPECGRPVKGKDRYASRHDNMVRAPLVWLRFFTTGATLMLLAAPCVVVMLLTSLATDGPVAPVLLGMFCLVWIAGVFIVTRGRPVTEATSVQPEKEWFWYRMTARASQCFWLLLCAMQLVDAMLGGGVGGAGTVSTVLEWVWIASFAVAGLGLIPLCILVSNLAFWAQDSILGNTLRSLSWVIGVCVTLTTLDMLLGRSGGYLNFFLFLGNNILVVVWMGMGFSALWMVRSMGRWAVINHVLADDHDYRMAEQAEGLIARQKKLEAERRREAVAKKAAGKKKPDAQVGTVSDDAPIPLAPERPGGGAEIAHLSSVPKKLERRPGSGEPGRPGDNDHA